MTGRAGAWFAVLGAAITMTLKGEFDGFYDFLLALSRCRVSRIGHGSSPLA